MDISIRIIQDEDAEAVNVLSKQLGYLLTIPDTLANITAINKSEDAIAYIAIYKNIPIGWIHIFCTTRLESGRFAEIGGMVVDEHYRGKGIGKLLIGRSKNWCKEKDIRRLVVRSNIKRKEAHSFYEGLGFRQIKEQKVLEVYIP